MTPKQQLILEFIVAYTKIRGYPPSLDNIAQGLEMHSRSNIHRHIHKLRKQGYLKVTPRKFRSIKVVDPSLKLINSL